MYFCYQNVPLGNVVDKTQMNLDREKSAAELYADLREAYNSQLPDYRKAYRLLNKVFLKSLNEHTDFAGVRFGGLFAKTDYLLKEHHAPRYLQRDVNDARVRLRGLRELSNDDLKQNFAYDWKAVCQFVSLLYGVPVPSFLEARFPARRTRTRGELKAACIRLVVDRWDDSFIYADVDLPDVDEVKVFYGGTSKLSAHPEWDWSYLKPFLSKGCQINIVRPRDVDSVLYPELFVWEPDYLVDISAVAACFEAYSVSPINYLLNKLKPSALSQSIVLGQLASQFLDEELAGGQVETTYGESVQKFFRSNALSLLTIGTDSAFHAQAQEQQKIIRDTLRRRLPKMLQSDHIAFDSSDVMVEPSFFSEMLGLQGRMDFLQLDHKVIIEQKSGKAAFPETDPPHEQTKHYVQLLLYMQLLNYNYREQYEKNNYTLQSFLLYSKYKNGLIRLGAAPGLVFQAFQLRNEIVAREYGYCRNGLSFLESLTSDCLNTNHVKGALWERFQKPQLDALLTPVQQASPLERAYFLRFMKFVETEHLLAKIGNQTKENSGFADKWYSSLEDKQQAGNIFYNLTLLEPAANSGCEKVDRVVLAFAEKTDHEVSNFRNGDIVVMYPYAEDAEPDVRKTMAFRATIEQIMPDRLSLSLRNTQANANVFWRNGEQKWAVEYDFFDSSYGSLYRGLHAFLTAPKDRRNLLLLQRKPAVDRNRKLVGDYGPFNDLALRVKQAQDLFLIIGPPGTGKTSFGLMNTLKEELASSEDSNVLLLSYTNRAVDEICSKLIEEGTDFIRLGGRFSCEADCSPFLLDSVVDTCSNIGQLREKLFRTRVFVGTTTAYASNIHLFKLKQFSLAVIDEASQILEPHLLGLLSAVTDNGESAIRKMVLIGDHKQLPAVVQQKEEESAVADEMLHAIHLTNCRLSLFERLLRQYRDEQDVVYMLTRQGRMHPDIVEFPNQAFYQGRLLEVPLSHQKKALPETGRGQNGIEDMLLTHRIAFVAVRGERHDISDKVNKNEARAIAATVARIYELHRQTFSPLHTVGVIVPYRNQIAEVRNCIEEYGVPVLRQITIDTIERFQGSQRDYILYGFTVRKYHQLSFLTNHVFEEDEHSIDRKLNVAMTRAREHLLLFGNPDLLAVNQVFSELMTFMRAKHSYFDMALNDYVEGNFKI